jgi:hypothetical protein
MIDLSSLDTKESSERGAVLELRHPETGKELGIKITLAGADSTLFVKASNKIAAARANANMTPARMKRMRQGRPMEVSEEDMEDQRQDAIKLLASVTLAWEGVVIGGSEVECSHEAAISLYARFPWIREQVDTFVNERSNFLAGSPGD